MKYSLKSPWIQSGLFLKNIKSSVRKVVRAYNSSALSFKSKSCLKGSLGHWETSSSCICGGLFHCVFTAGGLQWTRFDSVCFFVTVRPLCLRAYEHKGYCAAICVQTRLCSVSLLISFSAGRIHRWLCFLSCLLLHYIMVTAVALIDGSVLSLKNLEPLSCTHRFCLLL